MAKCRLKDSRHHLHSLRSIRIFQCFWLSDYIKEVLFDVLCCVIFGNTNTVLPKIGSSTIFVISKKGIPNIF